MGACKMTLVSKGLFSTSMIMGGMVDGIDGLAKDHLGGGFKYCFIFNPTWGNDPISLIFFKWVETTN